MRILKTKELRLYKGKFTLNTKPLTENEDCVIVAEDTLGIYIIKETKKCYCGGMTATKLNLATAHGGGIVEGDLNSMFKEPVIEQHNCTELIRYNDDGIYIDLTKDGQHLHHVIAGDAIMVSVLEVEEIIKLVVETLWEKFNERCVQ